jgi:hypothetical protein
MIICAVDDEDDPVPDLMKLDAAYSRVQLHKAFVAIEETQALLARFRLPKPERAKSKTARPGKSK